MPGFRNGPRRPGWRGRPGAGSGSDAPSSSDRPRRASKRAPAASAPPEKIETLTVPRGDETFSFRDRLPLLPLRDVVVFPYMTLPLLVGRLPSINAIEKAVARDRMLFVTAHKSSEVADPSHDEL